MFNCCIFCKFPITQVSVKEKRNVEGVEIIDIECSNCGAILKYKISIVQGPVRKNYVVNQRTKDGGETSEHSDRRSA